MQNETYNFLASFRQESSENIYKTFANRIILPMLNQTFDVNIPFDQVFNASFFQQLEMFLLNKLNEVHSQKMKYINQYRNWFQIHQEEDFFQRIDFNHNTIIEAVFNEAQTIQNFVGSEFTEVYRPNDILNEEYIQNVYQNILYFVYGQFNIELTKAYKSQKLRIEGPQQLNYVFGHKETKNANYMQQFDNYLLQKEANIMRNMPSARVHPSFLK